MTEEELVEEARTTGWAEYWSTRREHIPTFRAYEDLNVWLGKEDGMYFVSVKRKDD